MNTQAWIAILVGVAAMMDDLSRRHIANWIPAAALAGGFGWQIGTAGWSGALTAALGTVAGLSVFLIFYLMGGMGGGDVKLMAGFGALLGPGRLFEAALWTAGIGGILAVCALVWKMGWKTLRQRIAPNTAGGDVGTELTPEEREQEASIPYAPAIALGVWLSLVPKG